MRAWLFVLIALAWTAWTLRAFAHDDAIPAERSAKRDPAKSYIEYVARARLRGANLTDKATPLSAAQPYAKAVLPTATTWESESVMLARFQRLRDHRWLQQAGQPDFLRRSTWLYPDDGCYARAGVMVGNSTGWGFPVPSKIFVFGNLKVTTNNSPHGSVAWWYHVAPLVEVAGEKYVLDPALSPSSPVKLGEWLAKMSANPGGLNVAVCSSGSYDPSDTCDHVSDGVERRAKSDQTWFLEREWTRVEELGRLPENELGDSPPW